MHVSVATPASLRETVCCFDEIQQFWGDLVPHRTSLIRAELHRSPPAPEFGALGRVEDAERYTTDRIVHQMGDRRVDVVSMRIALPSE